MVDMAHFAGLWPGVPSEPGSVCRCGHLDDAQVLARPSRRPHPLPPAIRPRSSTRRLIPGVQGGPFMHAIAAKGVCFTEAMRPAFTDYAHQIVRNAKALAAGLIEEGFRLVSGGTDTHLLPRRRAPVRSEGQAGAAGARQGRDHEQSQHGPLSTPRSPSSAAGCVSAHRP